MLDQHMEQAEFVALATRILEAKGSPTGFGYKGKPSMQFEDEFIVIVSNHNGVGLEIERKAQPQSEQRHLHVSNPVTMVTQDGEIIRHHGEHAHITRHLLSLAAELEAKPSL